MRTDCLPEPTAQLFSILEENALLNNFVLVGGTALSLHLGHRLSEDLDLAFTGDVLPQKRIDLLLQFLGKSQCVLSKISDLAAIDDFLDAGLNLDHYQQNYIVTTPAGKTRLSFFVAQSVLKMPLQSSPRESFRVATIDEVFQTKCHAIADRRKTRDWIDLYVMMNQCGYTMLEFHETFSQHTNSAGFDIACQNLIQCQPSTDDEGYSTLMDNAPSIEELREFFVEQITQYRREIGHISFFDLRRPG